MDKPFSQEYVVETTVRNMRKCVDISISKTFERLPEFANDLQKSQEVFSTLALLHRMKKDLAPGQKSVSKIKEQ